ncbi:MAG: ParB/RepB/Spo0J family partition protein [Woeseiaceae bacterium]
MSKKKGLGRGLDALLGSSSPSSSPKGGRNPTAIFELPVSELVQGQSQPRQTVDEEDLRELALSIKQQGVLQPVLVRPLTGSEAGAGFVSHEIVAGERRWRAAKLAGLETVPVVIHEMDDKSALAIALVENLQRKDLNPIETAEALLRLTQDFELTHQQAADAIGRSRSSVSNLLRLLDLDYPTRNLLAEGRMDMGHARALLPLDTDQQAIVANKIETDRLSVRQVEKLVAELLKPSAEDRQATSAATFESQTRWLQKQLTKEAGLRVGIRNRADGSHTLNIGFKDLEQLQSALRKIETLLGQLRETAGPRNRDEDI